MKHLFDAELQHTGSVEISPTGPIDGKLVGGGAGKALGPLITGNLRWSLYENSTAAGCSMQLPGEIRTEDGALIQFEARGQGIVPDDKAPSHWRVGGAFHFQSKDERYKWPDAVLALWDGDFDMNTGKAFYRLYIPNTERQQK